MRVKSCWESVESDPRKSFCVAMTVFLSGVSELEAMMEPRNDSWKLIEPPAYIAPQNANGVLELPLDVHVELIVPGVISVMQ